VTILAHRFVEVGAMLPILHMPAETLVVGVAGPQSGALAREALRWRDVERLVCQQKLEIRDRRVERVKEIGPQSVDVMLLSVGQAPKPWLPMLKKDGIINTMTEDAAAVRVLRGGLHADLGNAMPWRDHLPSLIYGVLAKNGPGRPVRHRQPPAASQHLSKQFLPCLFTFAKDEMQIVFGPVPKG